MRPRAGILGAAAAALLLSSPPATAQDREPTRYEKAEQEKLRQLVASGHNSAAAGWGELFYGKVYETEFIVHNHCVTPEVVHYLFADLPYLTIEGVPMPAGSITVPPGETRYPAKVTTPAPPDIPILDPNAARMFPHGIYLEIKGVYRLEHAPMLPCQLAIEVVAVEGHIHFDPAGGGDGPTGDPCGRWWSTGEKPAGTSEATCLQRMRDLARSFREVVLRPLVEGDPQAWDWVPSTPEIGTMSIEALIAMKERADEGLAGVGPTGPVR